MGHHRGFKGYCRTHPIEMATNHNQKAAEKTYFVLPVPRYMSQGYMGDHQQHHLDSNVLRGIICPQSDHRQDNSNQEGKQDIGFVLPVQFLC